jgi:hypothetical protein
MELENIILLSEPGSKNQMLNVFLSYVEATPIGNVYMNTYKCIILNVYIKCIYEYIYDHIYIA